MDDREDEEAIGAVHETSQRVVPSQESSRNTEGAGSLDAVGIRSIGIIGKVASAEADEGDLQDEEHQEEHQGRLERAEHEERREDRPADEEQAHRVEEGADAHGLELAGNLHARREDQANGNPETAVGGQSRRAERVANRHLPHTSEELNETAVAKGQSDDNVRLLETTNLGVDHGEDEGREREGR